MTSRELDRLMDLLLKLHEESAGNGELRDEISHVRDHVDELLWSRLG